MKIGNILEINRDKNLQFFLFRRRVMEICNHYLISFDYNSLEQMGELKKLTRERITSENLYSEIIESPYSLKMMEKYLNEQPRYAEGFLFRDGISGEKVGFLWIMYQGGNESQYRIRKVEAFGFDFCVFKRFRGQQYIGAMLKNVLEYLHTEKGIDILFASVRKNNISALKAYRKIKANFHRTMIFGIYCGIRIPYPII